MLRFEKMKRRMIFVSPEFPYPAYSGGCLRTLSLLRCLAGRFDMHCVTFAQDDPEQRHLESLRSLVTDVTVLPLGFHRRTTLPRYARNIGRALRFVPPLVDRFSEASIRRALVPLLKKQADWVWLEHLWLAPYVASIGAGAVKVLDVHNIESDFYGQIRRASHNPLDRLGYYVFEQAARRIERRFLASFERILAVSEEDRRLLARDCPPEKIFVVPNAVNLPPLSEGKDSRDYTLYFAGRLDYLPNREAVQWFYSRVWPLIRSRLPEAKWCIVGAHPEVLGPKVRQDGHVVLVGLVDKTEPFLRRTSLVIVPAHVGGGTRFKILEAWAAGRAVISTAKGADGLRARHGENILIADTPEEFSNAVVRLLSDSDLRTCLGRKGWETVEEDYSLERLQERLEPILPRG